MCERSLGVCVCVCACMAYGHTCLRGGEGRRELTGELIKISLRTVLRSAKVALITYNTKARDNNNNDRNTQRHVKLISLSY